MLNVVGGCATWPLECACVVFVLAGVGWVVGGAPTAGEARELGFALETVPATLGPPTAVPLVGVNGMVGSIVNSKISKTIECFEYYPRWSKSRVDCGVLM